MTDRGSNNPAIDTLLKDFSSPTRGPIQWIIDHLYGHDLFLSYTRQDDPDSIYALSLQALLLRSDGEVGKMKRKALRPFLDVSDVPHDETLKQAIAKNIRASRYVVIIAGAYAGSHPWIAFEAAIAHVFKKPILIIDRGIRWPQCHDLLRDVVGDVRSIEAQFPGETKTGDTEEIGIRTTLQRFRIRRVRRMVWGSVIGILVASLVAVTWSLIEQQWLTAQEEIARQNAQKQSRISEARRLAAQSQLARVGYPQLCVLLAAEAMRAALDAGEAPVLEAERAMRDALQTVGGMPVGASDPDTSAIVISPDQHWLVVARNDGRLRVWDPNETKLGCKPIVDVEQPPGILQMLISKDSRWLVARRKDGKLAIWELSPAALTQPPVVLSLENGSLTQVDLSPDGKWIIAGADDGDLRIWQIPPKDAPLKLRGNGNAIYGVASSPDANMVAASTRHPANEILIWKTPFKSGASPLRRFPGKEEASYLAFSPNNRWLATGRMKGAARLWDLSKPTPAPVELPGASQEISDLDFSPDGKWFVTGIFGGARLWRMKENGVNPAVEVNGHSLPVVSLKFSPDSHLLITGGADGIACLWKLDDSKIGGDNVTFRGHDGSIQSISFHPHSHRVVTASLDGTARVWDMTCRERNASAIFLPQQDTRTPTGGEAELNEWSSDRAPGTVALSPDNRWAVTTTIGQGVLLLWDLSTPEMPRSYPFGQHDAQEDDDVMSISFAPDSRLFATFSTDAKLWRLDSTTAGPRIVALAVGSPFERATAIAFKADSRQMIVAEPEGSFSTWDLGATPSKTSTRNVVALHLFIGSDAFIECTLDKENSNSLMAMTAAGMVIRLDLQSPDPVWGSEILHQGDETYQAADERLPLSITQGGRLAIANDKGEILIRDLRMPLAKLPARPPPDGFVIIRTADGGAPADSAGNETDSANMTKEKPVSPRPILNPEGDISLVDFSQSRFGEELAERLAAVPPTFRFPTSESGIVTKLALSTDGHRLAAGYIDGAVKYWDLTRSHPEQTVIDLRGHFGREYGVRGLAFSQDGSRLISSSLEDSAPRVWELSPNRLLDQAARATGRNFHKAEWGRFFPEVKYRKTFDDIGD